MWQTSQSQWDRVLFLKGKEVKRTLGRAGNWREVLCVQVRCNFILLHVSIQLSPSHLFFPPLNYIDRLIKNQKKKEKEVKSLSCVRLFAIPWIVAHQSPPSMEFSRPEYWSGLPFPSPGDLPDPGIKAGSPTLQADALPSELSGKPILKKRNQLTANVMLYFLTLQCYSIVLFVYILYHRKVPYYS